MNSESANQTTVTKCLLACGGSKDSLLEVKVGTTTGQRID